MDSGGVRARLILALILATISAVVWPVGVDAEVAGLLLDVPWRSQIDGSPSQRANAGPASVGMVLAAYGRGASTAELRREHDRLAGQWQAPATPDSLAALASAYGLAPLPWAASAGEGLAAVRGCLERGWPVLMWLGEGEAPLQGRWVVAVGYSERGTVVYNDPSQPVAVYGQMRVLSAEEERTWLGQGAIGIALGDSGAVSGVVNEEAERPLAYIGGDTSPRWWRLIEVYAAWFGLDPYYVAAVALAESGGDPDAVGDKGHSVGLMQLHDAGVGTGLYDLRFDPALNLWHGTKALAAGMARFGDPYETYARYYNPGGQVAGERVMAWYHWLLALGRREGQVAPEPAAAGAALITDPWWGES